MEADQQSSPTPIGRLNPHWPSASFLLVSILSTREHIAYNWLPSTPNRRKRLGPSLACNQDTNAVVRLSLYCLQDGLDLGVHPDEFKGKYPIKGGRSSVIVPLYKWLFGKSKLTSGHNFIRQPRSNIVATLWAMESRNRVNGPRLLDCMQEAQ